VHVTKIPHRILHGQLRCGRGQFHQCFSERCRCSAIQDNDPADDVVEDPAELTECVGVVSLITST
jgi:hypothetical protein